MVRGPASQLAECRAKAQSWSVVAWQKCVIIIIVILMLRLRTNNAVLIQVWRLRYNRSQRDFAFRSINSTKATIRPAFLPPIRPRKSFRIEVEAESQPAVSLISNILHPISSDQPVPWKCRTFVPPIFASPGNHHLWHNFAPIPDPNLSVTPKVTLNFNHKPPVNPKRCSQHYVSP